MELQFSDGLLVRFSTKRDEIADAFDAIARCGNASRLAKLAPTSLVFGVWDSRGINVKLPRIIGATIRAYGAEKLQRSAQFFSVFDKEETEALGLDQKMLSGLGLDDAPAGRGPGGIIARAGIRREAILNLIALRALAGPEPEGTQTIQRYILGLALVRSRHLSNCTCARAACSYRRRRRWSNFSCGGAGSDIHS